MSNTKQVIVLSGPMTNIPSSNRPAFHAAAAVLRSAGHTVVSPAEHQIPDGATWGECMGVCLDAMSEIHKAWLNEEGTQPTLTLLPGFTNSPGSSIERALAHHWEWRIRIYDATKIRRKGAKA